jgi:hypothetical protein
MPFVPSGKNAERQRRRDACHSARAAALDRGIHAARMATNSPGLCLPMCVLLGRILDEGFPAHRFSLRLGALYVVAKDEERFGRISFDPRGPGGIDDGFHAWLEVTRARLGGAVPLDLKQVDLGAIVREVIGELELARAGRTVQLDVHATTVLRTHGRSASRR